MDVIFLGTRNIIVAHPSNTTMFNIASGALFCFSCQTDIITALFIDLLRAALPECVIEWRKVYDNDQVHLTEVVGLTTTRCLFCPGVCDVMQTTVPLKVHAQVPRSEDTIFLNDGEYFPAFLTEQITSKVLARERYTLLNTSNMGVGKTVSLKSILEVVLER